MAALGRVLQVIGWLWLISGFVLPMFNLPDLGFFPGLILVFVARILRRQADRQQLPDTSMGPVEPSETPPQPASREIRPAPTPEPARRLPPPVLDPEPDRDVVLEQVVLEAADRVDEVEMMADDAEMPASDPGDDLLATPKSSAEMIADARKRWNKPG